jgi:aromatic ring-opening dioxygenase LigB subunit
LIKIILKKNQNKKENTKKEKKHVGKHSSNPQCFVGKTIVITPHNLTLFVITCNYNSQPAQYKKT